MKQVLAFWLASMCLLLLVGCSGYGSPTRPPAPVTPGPAISPSENAVTIANYSFSSSTLQVSRGSKVTWTNNDAVDHTVSSDKGVFESGSLAPGASFSYTFNDAGVFDYYCSLHPVMSGKVIVQ